MDISRYAIVTATIVAFFATGCSTDGLTVSFGNPGSAATNAGDSTVNGTTSTGNNSGGPTAGNATETSGTVAQVIALVNDERAKSGLNSLTANAKLTAAAAAHADDMAVHSFFSHTGSDGASSADRATRAGYNWSAVGENIASGATSPAQVMDLWMNSSGHRANILNSNFTEIGVAVDTHGGLLWVQVFGRPQ